MAKKKAITNGYDLSDTTVLNGLGKSFFGNSYKRAFLGNFINNDTLQLVFCREVDSIFGLSFVFMLGKEKGFEKAFDTGFLAGSIKESKIEQITLRGSDLELLHYDSQYYFMGASGGEVFEYLINFKQKKVFSAHLYLLPDKKPALFIPKEYKSSEEAKFLVSSMTNKFNGLVLTEQDYVFN